MKKVLSLLSLVTLFLVTGGMKAMAASVDDLVAISSDYTFVADKITSEGTAKLVANTLYDENRIFAPTANSVAANKGKSTFGGEEHLNSLRLKNTQDQLVFKVARPCTVKFYTQSQSSRGIQVGSKAGGTEYGSQTASTTEWECKITQPGLVYLSSYNGDFYFAGFEVTFAPLTATFENDANWAAVFAYTWSGADESKVEHLGAWPGTQLTETDGKYVVSIKSENVPENIIFNDGGTNQTADLEFKDGGVYKSTGRVVEKKDFTVNFKTDAAWTTVYAYTWTGEEKQLGAWPGTAMTKVSDGEWTVTVNAEEAPASIIFHNNEGMQTADLTFEADKTYEYNLNTYTATFTTDGEWANVYAYAWSGSGDAVGEYPGQKLEAADGVYTFTYKAFAAPEMILFNDGGDTNKTPDMGFTNGRAYKWNTTLKPLFTLEASETNITAGTTLNVVDAAGDVVGYFTYGVEGGADFAAPTARQSDEYAAFVNYTAGNGENGTATSGTVYYIKPIYDGSVTVGVWLNGGKSFYIQEDGTSLAGFDGYKQDYGSGTAFTFNVKGGSTYAVFCTGSKLGFYGFDYTFTKPEPAETVEKMYIVGDFVGLEKPAEGDDPNWNPENGLEMTPSAENDNIWTLEVKGFVAEAKKYEYKATANKKWGVYELPAEGNQNFVFGTEGYPAGTYDLVFTADLSKNELSMTATKQVVLNDYTVQFVNNKEWQNVSAYAWSGDGETATKFLGEFPGTAMGLVDTEYQAEDGQKYQVYELKFQAEAAPEKILFNNGIAAGEEGAAQTADLAFEDGKQYVDDLKLTWTASYVNSQNWEKVYAYAWYAAPEGETGLAPLTGNWPGIEMTKGEEEGVYTISFEANMKPTGIIFSDGTDANKTADLAFEQGKKYEYVAPEVPAEDIEIKPESGDIAAALAAAIEGKKVGNIKIELQSNGEYTIGSTIEVPANLTIWGNDATIDASALTAAFAANPAGDLSEWAKHAVEIRGIKVKGLGQPLFASAAKGYLYETFLVDGCVIEATGNPFIFDFRKGSVAEKLFVTNSTIYAATATSNSLYTSQSGQKATEAGVEMQTFVFYNNTIYNFAKGKNFFTHRQSNQTWLAYDVQNNVFVNCGKSGQVIKGMNGGQGGNNPTWTIKNNIFNFDGADTSAAESTGDTTEGEEVEGSIAGVITFTDAAAGDFNAEFELAEGATAPETAIGAPIWTITYKAAPVPADYYLVGNMTEWSVNENYKLTKNENAGEGVEEYMINVTLASDAQFKIVGVQGGVQSWYPDGMGNNYGENGELTSGAGDYTVYFRPNRDGGDDWFHGYIYVVYTTGINSIAIDQKLKDAEIYNLNGQRVLNAKKGLYIVNGKKVVIK